MSENSLQRLIEKGNQHISLGEPGKARQWFKKALELDAESAQALDGLGWTYYMEGRSIEARTTIERAIHCDPEWAEAYTDLGCVMQDLGEPGEAERLHRASIKKDPTRHDAHFNLGLLYRALGKNKEAIKSLLHAHGIDSSHSGTLQTIGEIRYEEGNVAVAKEMFRKALECEPDNIEIDLLCAIAESEVNSINGVKK